MNTKHIIFSILLLIFSSLKTSAQCTEISCVILIDGKIPGFQYITNAYFEYQDSVKNITKIPITHIFAGAIDITDSNLRILHNLISGNKHYTQITLHFEFNEWTNYPSSQVKHILHYSCALVLDYLLEGGNNVISFYNIDKDNGTYFYYYYLDGLIGRSSNASPYEKEEHRIFYNQ